MRFLLVFSAVIQFVAGQFGFGGLPPVAPPNIPVPPPNIPVPRVDETLGAVATAAKAALDVVPLNPSELLVLNGYSDKFNLKFDTETARRIAFDNLNIASKAIDSSNELFKQGLRTYELALYKFSHLTDEIFGEKYLGLAPPSDIVRRKREALKPEECKDVPESLNWAKLNKVAHVKDQKECGSCFIFSSTGAIESAVAIEYGISPINMSIQHQLNCILDPKTGKQNGCTGGRPEWVWKAAKESGGAFEQTSSNEYTGEPGGECDSKAKPTSFSKIDFWERVTFQGTPEEVEEQIKCRLAKSGPFHISMTVKKNEMGSFKSGVYKAVDGACKPDENVNHGLLLVGYGEKLIEGDKKPTKYWVIQNSWGDRWGEDGYLYVERGVNICNFATDAYFPVLKKILSPIDKPAVCKETKDLFNSGKYKKSLCLVEEEKTYEDAQLFCLNNGMRLFQIESQEDKDSLMNHSNKQFSSREDFSFFVGGVEMKGESPACTSISNSEGTFLEDKATDCTNEFPFACEFINKNPSQ